MTTGTPVSISCVVRYKFLSMLVASTKSMITSGFSFSKTGNSSYITVNVSYKYGGKLHSASQQYYVDEYGSVY